MKIHRKICNGLGTNQGMPNAVLELQKTCWVFFAFSVGFAVAAVDFDVAVDEGGAPWSMFGPMCPWSPAVSCCYLPCPPQF